MKQIRINFDDAEWESVQLLMREYSVSTPQKLLRSLVINDVIRGSKVRLRAVPRETTPPRRRMTIGERRAAMERMGDEELTALLKTVLDEEFRGSPRDEIAIVSSPDGGARMINMILYYESGGNEKSSVMLSSMLNKWEKEKRLPDLPAPVDGAGG